MKYSLFFARKKDLIINVKAQQEKRKSTKSKIIPLRVSLSSSDFPIVLSIGQFNECCQTNPAYAGKVKLPAAVNHDR